MLKRFSVIVSALAAIFMVVAPASASTNEFYVAGGTTFVQVTESHGPLVHFNVAYAWDNYQHADIISATNDVSELDNYTGQNPDTGAKFNGCANTRQPDELFNSDVDKYGNPGQQPHTSLHHDSHLTFTPVNNGKAGYSYFLWCHYEHGPETWVTLTFQDGTVFTIYWNKATYFNEILISDGSANTVTAVGADD